VSCVSIVLWRLRTKNSRAQPDASLRRDTDDPGPPPPIRSRFSGARVYRYARPRFLVIPRPGCRCASYPSRPDLPPAAKLPSATGRPGRVPRSRIEPDMEGDEAAVLDQLKGQLIPDLELDTASGRPFDFVAHARLLIYLYPGASGIIRGDETPLIDAEQHRAFRDRCEDFQACNFTVLGISSQSIHRQRKAVEVNKLLHELLSDPNFQLAEALDLPTRRVGSARVYERLTLLVRAGWINQALDSLPTPERHPTFVARLLQLQG
jgi:peroxiredoxin